MTEQTTPETSEPIPVAPAAAQLLPPVMLTADINPAEGVRILLVSRPTTPFTGTMQVPVISQMTYKDAATAVAEVTELLTKLIAIANEVSYHNGVNAARAEAALSLDQPTPKE